MPAGYLKCTCAHCGGHIEFPVDAIGTVVPCPHCGRDTELSLDDPAAAAVPDTPSHSRKWMIAGLVILILGIVLGIGALLVAKNLARKAREKRITQGPPRRTGSAPQNAPAANPTITINDFNVSSVKLERTPGSTLVHATGLIQNNTDKPRFGITVELDLLDTSGAKIGSTKDYRDSIEPRAEWSFRALVLTKNAASARVADVREQ